MLVKGERGKRRTLKNFEYEQLKASAYSHNRYGSWQHQLPKRCVNVRCPKMYFNPYPTAFPYENGMVLHFYQQQESSTTKTVHKVINKGLKTYV